MKEKISKSLQLFSFIAMLNLLLASCEKDLYEQPTDTSFSPEDAKDWYYSNLKTTEKLKVSNKKNETKIPDWKHGAYRKTGDFEIVEFPLLKDRKTLSLPKNNLFTDAIQKRILNGSLTRVVFIKNGSAKIELRELHYIPDYKYLERKGFDISGVNLSKEKNDFSGTLIIKTWDSKMLAIHILLNGKIIKSSIIKKKTKNSNLAKTATTTCTWYETVEYEQICTYICYGDDCNPTGECTNWTPTGNVSLPYEVCTDDGLGCEFSSDPSCECNLYGLGCNGGGDGAGAPIVPAIIINDQALKNNPCLNEVYSKLGQASGFDYYLKRFDGNNSVANLNFAIGTLGGNTYGETSPPNNGSITITLDAGRLAETPPLFVADIFIHEIIHAEMFRKMMIAAESGNIDPTIMTTQQQMDYVESLRNNFPGLYDYYMRYEYNVPSGQEPSNAMHELMAQHYISTIVSALKQYDNAQTEDTYKAIAWFGLKGTGNPDNITGLLPNSTTAWKNLSMQERLNLLKTLNDFKNNAPKCQN